MHDELIVPLHRVVGMVEASSARSKPYQNILRRYVAIVLVTDLAKSKGYASNQTSLLSETRKAFYWLSRDAKMCVSHDEGPSILAQFSLSNQFSLILMAGLIRRLSKDITYHNFTLLKKTSSRHNKLFTSYFCPHTQHFHSRPSQCTPHNVYTLLLDAIVLNKMYLYYFWWLLPFQKL